MDRLEELKEKFNEYKHEKLSLNMQRGQPSNANFDISNPMLTCVKDGDFITESGVDIRNYPGGVIGLKEARELFSGILGVDPDEMVVGNNASLKMLSNVLMWGLLRGLKNSKAPWSTTKNKIIVTVPGYDRHFRLLNDLGVEMISVDITSSGPDMDRVEELVAGDDRIKGLLFVPIYSNPTGDSVSDETVKRLACMKTAAEDFTIFADNAYAVHHLYGDTKKPPDLLEACKNAGNPNRVYIFGSTSKITFAGAGIGFFGTSRENLEYITKLMGSEFIGPNKIEQYRHVKFISGFEGGITGLMNTHAEILRPKFQAVDRILSRELGGSGLAEWTKPRGGYFISLNTKKPVARRVVELAKEAGVSLTPAGATYPFGKDPCNSNIRIAPTRPPLEDIKKAMKILGICIKIASME